MEELGPAIGQPEDEGLPTHIEQCHACGQQRGSSWQSQVDTMLSLILERVARVEDMLGTVMGGISVIGTELKVIGRHFSKDVQVQTTNNNA